MWILANILVVALDRINSCRGLKMEIPSPEEFRKNGTIHKNLSLLLVVWAMLAKGIGKYGRRTRQNQQLHVRVLFMEISSQGQFRENGTIHKNLWVLLVLWTMLVTEVCVNVKTLRISLNTTNSSRGFGYNLTLKISIYETTANILTKPLCENRETNCVRCLWYSLWSHS